MTEIEPLDDERYEEIRGMLTDMVIGAEKTFESIDENELILTYIRVHEEQAWDGMVASVIRIAIAFRNMVRQEAQTTMMSRFIKAADSDSPNP